MPTDHFQRSLPRLPIPEVDKTCERYLATQKALLPDADFRRTQVITEEFKTGVSKGMPGLGEANLTEDKVDNT